MIVAAVPDPQNWDRWDEAKAYLEPARIRGEFETVIEPDEALWVCIEDDELLGCATAWLSDLGYVEVKLVGGRDHPRWLGKLDQAIGKAAALAGATRLVAMGRRGWAKPLLRIGWERLGEADGMVAYARDLAE